MPVSVIFAVVLMGLIVCANLWAAGFGGNTVVSALLLLGFFKGHRLAWQWGRIFPILGGLGIAIAILIPAIATHSLDAQGWIYLGVVGMCLSLATALGRSSARAYFGLICPKCGKPTRQAADFFFNKARCRSCDYTW